jgi:hypothetical protein
MRRNRRPLRAGLVAAALAIAVSAAVADAGDAQELPAGGTTAWEIRGPEELVTFALFDPKAPGPRLPAGLRFVPARDAQMPEIAEHVAQHPEHADWAFSIVEIARQEAFLLDGKAPSVLANGGIGLWFAPVDASPLASEIGQEAFDRVVAPALGAVLALAIWVPDRDYVAYMRERGHYAECGDVTLVSDSSGVYQGRILLDNLKLLATAKPHGEADVDSTSGTQVLFEPGARVERGVVIAGSTARHRACEATWAKGGMHPLARAVFVGPTYLTTYDQPLRGSAYTLVETEEP